VHADVRARLRRLRGVDLFAWLSLGGENPVERTESGPPHAGEVVVERDGAELRFRPGTEVVDLRGRSWDLEGDEAALEAEIADGRIETPAYPDALGRLWGALRAPQAGDILVSASPGYELVDWGGVTHCPGGSHGALDAGDSLAPLLLCGLDAGIENSREQWALRDVAALVLGHFGIEPGAASPPSAGAVAAK
jgi:hypothetical protein